MLISIIIPVYNVEKYLDECLISILNQEFKDYEIILINDGSKDNSGNICNEYSQKYSFISVIHQKNKGLSEARNSGLRIAKGEYILFIDSDDYIEKGSLKLIAKKVAQNKKIDVVFLNAIKFYPDGKKILMKDGYIEKKINGKSKNEVMKYLANLSKFPGSACTKLISNKLIRENELYFQKNLLSEDIEWTVRLLKVANNFLYINIPYYYYRQFREGSITNTNNLKRIECIISIIKKYSNKNIRLEYQEEINSFMAYEFIVILYNYSLLLDEEKKNLKNELKKLEWILDNSYLKKFKIIKYMLKILDYNITSLLLKNYRDKVLRRKNAIK